MAVKLPPPTPTAYTTKHCLFCGTDACLRDLYPKNFRDEDLDGRVFSARRITEHYHYDMVRCANTGLVFSREILPEETLKKLYAGSSVTFGAYTDIIRRDYWRPLRPFSTSLVKGSALEIGCSSGFFLEELRHQGFREVHGCEPSIEAKAQAHASVRSGIHTGFFTESVYPDESFDLICSFQTLDHLSEPLEMLRTCLHKLKPGGMLYLIVHDVDSLQARLFGEKSPIIDVEHIYLFNPKTLALAVETVGLETVKAFPVRNAYPLEYWVAHAPLPCKRQIGAALKALGLAKVAIPLSLGNMGILARKPAA